MKRKYAKYILLLVLLETISCKMPVVLVATQESHNNYNCELLFYTGIEDVSSDEPVLTVKKFKNIEVFKSEYKKEIMKQSNRCKCDTVFIDIFHSISTLKNDTSHVWGWCKSRK